MPRGLLVGTVRVGDVRIGERRDHLTADDALGLRLHVPEERVSELLLVRGIGLFDREVIGLQSRPLCNLIRDVDRTAGVSSMSLSIAVNRNRTASRIQVATVSSSSHSAATASRTRTRMRSPCAGHGARDENIGAERRCSTLYPNEPWEVGRPSREEPGGTACVSSGLLLDGVELEGIPSVVVPAKEFLADGAAVGREGDSLRLRGGERP